MKGITRIAALAIALLLLNVGGVAAQVPGGNPTGGGKPPPNQGGAGVPGGQRPGDAPHDGISDARKKIEEAIERAKQLGRERLQGLGSKDAFDLANDLDKQGIQGLDRDTLKKLIGSTDPSDVARRGPPNP